MKKICYLLLPASILMLASCSKMKDFTAENFPNAENQYSRTISIPLFPDMTNKQIQFVIDTIKKIGFENHA